MIERLTVSKGPLDSWPRKQRLVSRGLEMTFQTPPGVYMESLIKTSRLSINVNYIHCCGNDGTNNFADNEGKWSHGHSNSLYFTKS